MIDPSPRRPRGSRFEGRSRPSGASASAHLRACHPMPLTRLHRTSSSRSGEGSPHARFARVKRLRAVDFPELRVPRDFRHRPSILCICSVDERA